MHHMIIVCACETATGMYSVLNLSCLFHITDHLLGFLNSLLLQLLGDVRLCNIWNRKLKYVEGRNLLFDVIRSQHKLFKQSTLIKQKYDASINEKLNITKTWVLAVVDFAVVDLAVVDLVVVVLVVMDLAVVIVVDVVVGSNSKSICWE